MSHGSLGPSCSESSERHSASDGTGISEQHYANVSFQAEPFYPDVSPQKDDTFCTKSTENDTSEHFPTQKSHLYRCPTTGRFYRAQTSTDDVTQTMLPPNMTTGSDTNTASGYVESESTNTQTNSSSSRNLASTNNTHRDTETVVCENASYDYQCPVENPFEELSVDRIRTVPGLVSFSDVLRSKTSHTLLDASTPDQSNIPVRLSNRDAAKTKPRQANSKHSDNSDYKIVNTTVAENASFKDQDDEFSTYIRRRASRFYIGGFKHSITEQKLVNYVFRRGVTVSWINIRRYEDQDRAVIQLNVDAEQGARVLERGFWPEGVICRPWYPKNQYRQRIATRYRYGNDDTATYTAGYQACD